MSNPNRTLSIHTNSQDMRAYLEFRIRGQVRAEEKSDVQVGQKVELFNGGYRGETASAPYLVLTNGNDLEWCVDVLKENGNVSQNVELSLLNIIK